uniref:Uncharacterized protein n=1 Tax=Arundo donax TaxID=35708 RepID=A0A0A9A8S5_ARUDO
MQFFSLHSSYWAHYLGFFFLFIPTLQAGFEAIHRAI